MNKQFSLFVIALFYSIVCRADVAFKFLSATINFPDTTRVFMERNISDLLTEINRAASKGSSLNLSEINIDINAKERLMALWEVPHFACDEDTIISKCIQDFQGYQAQSIPITMKPHGLSNNQSLNRELSISLSRDGLITGVRFAWESMEDVSKILTTTGSDGIIEARSRREILKWLEDYRTLYTVKDIDGISSILLAEDIPVKIGKNNQQFILTLKRLFTHEKQVSVEFEYISIQKHYAKPNIYGLTFHQMIKTEHYHDAGWFFFLWDFNDTEKPHIYVSTWQSDQDAAKDGVFKLENFFIP